MRDALREVAQAYLVVGALAFAATRLRSVPVLGEQVHLVVGALFLLAALRLAQRDPGGLRRFGIDLGGVLEPVDDGLPSGPLGARELGRSLRRALPSGLREAGVALLVAAVIFPPFALGFRLWNGARHPFELSLPPAAFDLALTQLVVVALPEEAFFRGYVQTRLGDAFPARARLLGASVSVPAWLLQAALFALVHLLVDPRLDRLAVFFPGLVFGWLRAWRGGIGAAIVFHAASNLYSEILTRGWLS